MSRSHRKHDSLTLMLAGGVAAALIGAAGASSWVWLRQRPGETARAHRKRATGFTAIAFGAAGALGAAAAAALLGPRAARPSMRMLEHLADRVGHDWDGVVEHAGGALGDLRGAARRGLHRLH